MRIAPQNFLEGSIPVVHPKPLAQDSGDDSRQAISLFQKILRVSPSLTIFYRGQSRFVAGKCFESKILRNQIIKNILQSTTNEPLILQDFTFKFFVLKILPAQKCRNRDKSSISRILQNHPENFERELRVGA